MSFSRFQIPYIGRVLRLVPSQSIPKPTCVAKAIHVYGSGHGTDSKNLYNTHKISETLRYLFCSLKCHNGWHCIKNLKMAWRLKISSRF